MPRTSGMFMQSLKGLGKISLRVLFSQLIMFRPLAFALMAAPASACSQELFDFAAKSYVPE